MNSPGFCWENFEITVHEASGKNVEAILWQTDIASEHAMGTDLDAVKKSLIHCALNFSDNKGVVTRVYQLLSDIEMLASPSARINNHDLPLVIKFFAEHCVAFNANVDVALSSFEFMSVLIGNHSGLFSEHLTNVSVLLNMTKVLQFHIHSNPIKRAALKIFSVFFSEVQQRNAPPDMVTVYGALLPVCADILLINREESDIVCTSLSILCNFLQHAPGRDVARPHYGTLVSGVSALLGHVAHPEKDDQELDASICSQCFAILDIVLDGSTNENCLLDVAGPVLRFCATSVKRIFNPKTQGDANILALGSLLRVLLALVREPDLLCLAMDDLSDIRVHLTSIFQALEPIWSGCDVATFSKCDLVCNVQRAACGRESLALLASFKALPDGLQPVSIRTDPAFVSNPNPPPAHAPESTEIPEKLSTPLFSKDNIVRKVVVQDMTHACSESTAQDQAEDVAHNFSAATTLPISTKNEEASVLGNSSSAGDRVVNKDLIAFANDCHKQASLAISRADMMHGMFLSAAKRIEVLMEENRILRMQVVGLGGQVSDRPHASASIVPAASFDGDTLYAAFPQTPVHLKDCSSSVGTLPVTPEREQSRLQKPQMDNKQVAMIISGMHEALSALRAQKCKSGEQPLSPEIMSSEQLQPYVETFKLGMAYAKAHFSTPTEKLKPGSLALSSVRRFVKAIGLLDAEFTMKDVDIILSHVGVHHVSVFGFTYILLICAGKRYPYHSYDIILTTLCMAMSGCMSSDSATPNRDVTITLHRTSLGAEVQGLVNKLLDSEKHTLHVIFQSYVANVLHKRKHWSLESALSFALDFEIIPQVAAIEQLHALFRQHAREENKMEYQDFCDLLVSLAHVVNIERRDLTWKFDAQGPACEGLLLLCDLFMLMNSRVVHWHTKVSKRLMQNHRSIPVVSFNLQSIRVAQQGLSPQPAAASLAEKLVIL